ncbi:MAG: LysR family transcriptional regulator [Cohaesibacteraceae bacterium]
MPDINALRSFVLAAETLNFSEVAARRNTMQSAVSAHIAKLEEELTCTLFSRGRGQAMYLTAEGQAFLAYARRILALSDESVDAMRSARSRRIVRLGTTVTMAMSVLPMALRLFSKARPDVQIHVQCDRSDALLGRLDQDEIDVAFMMDQGRRMGRDFVEGVPLVWAGGDGFVLEPTDDVPLAFLTDGRDLRRYAFEALDKVGRTGYLAHLSPAPVGVRAFIQADLALTLMPDVSVTPPLRIFGREIGLPDLKPIALALYRGKGVTSSDVDDLSETLQALVR